MGTYVVTGSASGIGAATSALLRERGHRAVGVDRAGADVVADLSTEAALAWWARSVGTGKEWVGASIRVNAVAPGLIATAMTEELRRDPVLGGFADTYPTALRRPGTPEEIAALVAFLLSEEASLLVGSVVYADGGTDALLRKRWPKSTYVPRPVMTAAGRAMSLVARLQQRRQRAAR